MIRKELNTVAYISQAGPGVAGLATHFPRQRGTDPNINRQWWMVTLPMFRSGWRSTHGYIGTFAMATET